MKTFILVAVSVLFLGVAGVKADDAGKKMNLKKTSVEAPPSAIPAKPVESPVEPVAKEPVVPKWEVTSVSSYSDPKPPEPEPERATPDKLVVFQPVLYYPVPCERGYREQTLMPQFHGKNWDYRHYGRPRVVYYRPLPEQRPVTHGGYTTYGGAGVLDRFSMDHNPWSGGQPSDRTFHDNDVTYRTGQGEVVVWGGVQNSRAVRVR